MSIRQVSILFLLFVCLGSCTEGLDTPKRPVPDLSNIDLKLELVRYDSLLMEGAKTVGTSIGDSLMNQFPQFSPLYFGEIMQMPLTDKVAFYKELELFTKNEGIRQLYDTIQQVYGNFNPVLKDIELGAKILKYHFPNFLAPRLYTMMSDFGFQRAIFEDKDRDGYAIGLDMFLSPGMDYKALDPKNPSFSNYLTRSFNKSHLPKIVLENLLDDQMGSPYGVRMIDYMIHHGKRQYFLSHLLPEAHDTILHEYTADQWKWCQENELEMYSFFLDEELFYETNQMKINKYLFPSPTSAGMPQESPGRTANFIGYKIVLAYMKRFPETSWEELLALKDSQVFLEKSRYKPKTK